MNEKKGVTSDRVSMKCHRCKSPEVVGLERLLSVIINTSVRSS